VGDFDFLVGSWNVANRRLIGRLAGSTEWEEFASTATCRNLFGGAANIDEFTFSDGTYGATFRVFDPARKEWSLNWANSINGVMEAPLFGTFSDGVGTFHGDDTFDGGPIRVRFIWSRITPTSARWEQAFSADQEQTWETNWVMDFTRTAD